MSIQPSIREVAFDCPHCGAFTSQTWFDLYAEEITNDERIPSLADRDWLEEVQTDDRLDTESKNRIVVFLEKGLSGFVFLDRRSDGKYIYKGVHNLNLSLCFACKGVAVWVHDRLIFPIAMEADLPSPDLPDNVRIDYEEASRIVGLSPRGAAALLRLAIQKLCAFLGEKGKNIDDDIASLVRKGLLPVVQQSLDSLRVIGNEAVHPGMMDLKDDRDTASQLFKLVNIIAEQMISSPKQANEVYAKLPQHKRDAIEKRDRKK